MSECATPTVTEGAVLDQSDHAFKEINEGTTRQ